MKKLLIGLLVLLLSGGAIFGFLRYKDYQALKNPVDEIYYSSTHYKNILGLPLMSRLIRSNTAYVGEPAWIYYNLKNPGLEDGERDRIYVNSDGLLALEYRKQLSEDSYLYIIYIYEENEFHQEISVGFSKKSDFYVQETINELKKMGSSVTAEDIYSFSETKEVPPKSLTSKEEVLDYLKDYGIDQAWLAEKSDQVLYTYFLDIWFKEGSQRYSKEDMGNLKIKYSDILGK